jgi:hypothetical protein
VVIISIVPESLLLFLIQSFYYIRANECGWDYAGEIVVEHHEHMEAFHQA